MNQRCIDEQTPPRTESGDALAAGDLLTEGEFLRNLKKRHVVKRYEDDDNENPAYAFKLSPEYWKSVERQSGGLSVNLRSCIHSEVCSIALHRPGGEHFFHVAILNLRAINDCGVLTSPVVAQYTPNDETNNRCHFDLVSLDGTVLKWMELRVFLDSPFPKTKVPSTDEEKSTAAAANAQYQSYCNIRLWVRRKEDGKLVI
jgi:hypothetical protein